MAFVVETLRNSGEGTVSDDSDHEPAAPSLKDFLSEHSVPDDIYTKLHDGGIGWNELLHVEKDDLDTLCGKEQLNLSFALKIKFKGAVKQLQSKYKPQQYMIPITMNEQKNLNKISLAAKQANDIQILLENHLNEIEDQVVDVKSSVDKEFEEIAKKLEKRKKSLYKQVNYK